MRRAIGRALVAVLLPSVLPSQDDWGRHTAKTKLSLLEAIERGQKAAGSGTAVHAELELDGGRLVYSIDVSRKQTVVNVVLDVRNGKEIERSEDADDQRALVAACKVSLATAIGAATRKVPGPPIEAQMLLDQGKPVIDVWVWKDTRQAIRIDGVTGAVVDAGGDALVVADGPRFTDRFDVPPADLQPHGTNPFFVLVPGHKLVLEGKDGNDAAELVITVLSETRRVAGVTCAIVEERESKGGKLVEVSRNFYAIGKRTNDVYCFGKDVDIHTDGAVTSHAGAWLAGADGARCGLIMPGTPLLGARYHQAVAPGVAMDRAEVVSLDEVFSSPAGRHERVLKIEQTTTLAQGTGYKFYAAGVGMVSDGKLRLARFDR